MMIIALHVCRLDNSCAVILVRELFILLAWKRVMILIEFLKELGIVKFVDPR